ncbi:amino acid ABC transporter substrate-binding protein (PAAT family) [Stella humosa]|uniref:Amino acid ABC transporter substrate-binding protein (PAAT family) n=1 Tax=Stella humosa TaxID=94 RepID=A0A3N1M8B5_9PROT|nr:transporter substrate-binding domain-containing protein [Stella humosa]ROP99952.1 amino acid ABC transporter substrate-binding protein (PAAT family) [Stella humosa]BBK30817.1 amino acid ABC substrate-binding protein [Stella humosa]
MHGWLRRLGPLCFLILAFPVILGIPATAIAQDLPPLPADIKRHGLLRVGVNCDYPPDGFVDQSGRPAGIEVDLARQIAAYAFGRPDRIDVICVSAANRIPWLVGRRLDLVLATFSINEERARQIAFSAPYAWGVSDMLVAADGPLGRLDDLGGKTVIVIRGTWQVGWFERNLPEATLLPLDTVSEGLQALLQGRGAGFAHDQAVLQALGNKNPRVRLLGEPYQLGHRGAGMRQQEPEWVAYVDAAIARARRDRIVERSVRRFVEPAQVDAALAAWDLATAPAQVR